MNNNLPKFLLCFDGADERSFVFHAQQPRFLLEFHDNGEGPAIWLDPEPEPKQSAQLVREAGEFYYRTQSPEEFNP